MNVRAVLFDMDGTMFDTEQLHLLIFRQVLCEMNIPVDAARYLDVIGMDDQAVAQHLIQAYALNTPARQETFRRLYEQYRAQILADENIAPMPGLFDLLDYLQKTQLRWGIVSSSPIDTIQRYLHCCRVEYIPDVIVDSSAVIHCKPSPEPFLLAARRLSLPSSACVALEDSPWGIRSAHEAGMCPVMIPNLVEPTERHRQYTRAILPSLFHAIEFLEQYRLNKSL